MDAINIREAVFDDMRMVIELIGQSDMSPDNELTLQQAGDLFNQISQTGCHKIYVVELGSSIIATFALVVVQQLSHNGAKSVIIEDIVVATELQNQGIGKQIIKFAADVAQTLGAYKICLSSGHARLQAHAFYKRMGYEQDGYRFALTLRKST